MNWWIMSKYIVYIYGFGHQYIESEKEMPTNLTTVKLEFETESKRISSTPDKALFVLP